MASRVRKPSGPPNDSRPGELNRFLRALPADSYDRLIAEVEPLEMPAPLMLWESNARIRSVYFPRTCVISLLMPLPENGPVEAATVGNEGWVGVPLIMGSASTTAMALVQVSGEGLRMPAATFLGLLERDATLRARAMLYAHALFEQTAQSVACNRRHSMSQRCARWLLMTHDRVLNGEFVLTQEFLAMMLGVRRATVTVAAGMLQEAGLIKYSRGRVTVVDRERLEEASCDCYRIVEDSYRRTMIEPFIEG
jgi:CRP-like cAMP-binding protein